MVVLHKCDVCGRVMDEGMDIGCFRRVEARIGRVDVKTILGIDGTWNGGHICNQCLADIFRKIADILEKAPEKVRK